MGVDPYVLGDTEISARAHVKKLGVDSCEGQWDLVLANHCLEHVEEPENFMRELKRLLAPNGTLVLRVPIFGKYAWRRYGTHWFQIDAPRHIFIPSQQTIQMLAQKCDLAINVAKFDSSETQFWGSSRYEKGVSLSQSDMKWRTAILKIARIPYWYPFYCAAQALNWKGDGDQAVFYLKHVEVGSIPP
jgi:SAM-dependent methyltransferase